MRISEIDLRLRNDKELAQKALSPEGCRENGAATSLFVSCRSTGDMRLPHASRRPILAATAVARVFQQAPST